MTIRKSLVTGLILGPVCSCGLAATAGAQNAVGAAASAAAAAQLQQVTVTANFIRPGGQSALKMNVPVQDVPYSLEDYSQSFMQAVDTTRLTDLYGYMSGVQRAGPSGYDISIRGFTSGSTDPNSVLMDGLPGLPARTASPETADLARVEVVKGPASVLYGQDQPGGFINLITKKPQEHYETNVELRANTWDGAGISFGQKNGYTGIVDTTGPIAGDTLLGRAIVQYTNQQSFREFVLDKDVMLAPSLTWNISDRTRATLLLEFRHGNDSWDQGLVAPKFDSKLIAPITTRYQNPEDKEMEKGETATLLLHHAFSHSLSWDFNARSVYSEDYEIGADNSAILKDLTQLGRLDRDQDNHHHINFIDTSVTDLFHTGPIGHRLLAGLTYGETLEDYNRIRNFKTPLLNIDIYDPIIGYNDIPPPPASEPPQAHEWATARQKGAYATDLLSFSEHWKGVVGVRYQDVDQVQKELRIPNKPNAYRKFSSTFPMGGLIYQPTKEWSLYASYSSSFVPPNPTAQSVIPGQTLQAQTATQEEVGAKFASRTGRVSATLSLFNIKEINLIEEVGITGLYEQIGAVRSRGAEFEVDVRPTNWWQLSANYALIDAHIIDDVVQAEIGSMPMNSPRNSGSILSRMQLPGRLSSFGWMLGAIYRSERVGNLPTSATSGAFIMPGYTTVDTGIYYTADTYSISLKVANILDKRYFQSAFSAVRIAPGDPRNFSLTLNKTFE